MKSRTVLLSLAEQGLVSLGMLATTAGVISQSGPEGFGHFSFALTLVLISASLQYGLVGTPLLVNVRPLEPDGRAAALKTLLAFDFYFRALAALIVAAGTAVASGDLMLAASAGVFGLVYLWRESMRNTLFAIGDAECALTVGVVTFLLLLVLLFLFLDLMPEPGAAGFLAFALANAIGLSRLAAARWTAPSPPMETLRTYRSEFPLTGWTFANSAANELQMRSHVIMLQILRGPDQLGVVEATRVLFGPLQLISGAWQRAMQPSLATFLQSGDAKGAWRLTSLGLAGIATIAVAYALVIWLSFDLISEKLFEGRYGDLRPYAIAWAILTALLLINWTIVSFLNAMHDFRKIALVTAGAAVSTVAMLTVLALDVPPVFALVVPILVQICVMAALLYLSRRGLARLSRQGASV